MMGARRWLLLVWAVATSAFAPSQAPRGASVVCLAESDDLGKLLKAELVTLCREQGLKVSGTKAVLIERLRTLAAAQEAEEAAARVAARRTEATREAAQQMRAEDDVDAAAGFGAAAAAAAPTLAASAEARDPQLVEASIDLLISEVAALEPSAVTPDLLASKKEQLLAKEGAVLDAVAQRRLAAAPRDERLAGAIALVRGFARMEQQLRSRDSMREILRAATLGGEALDRCFSALAGDGRLDGPLGAYVDDLIAQQAPKGGEGLLDKVLVIVKDRIGAEKHVAANDELRCLATALRCRDDAATLAFLSDRLATSIDFATRFEAYVADAQAFLEANRGADDGDPVADEARLAGVRKIRDFVSEIRRSMPV